MHSYISFYISAKFIPDAFTKISFSQSRMAKRKADDRGVQEVALNDTREMAEPSDADDSMVNIKVCSILEIR